MVFQNAILMGQVSDFSRTFRLDGAKPFDSLEIFPTFKNLKSYFQNHNRKCYGNKNVNKKILSRNMSKPDTLA